MNKSRFLNLFALTALIITSIFSIPVQTVNAQDYGLIAVLIEDNIVLGFHWPVNALLTLTINDLATTGLDYSAEAIAEIDPGNPESTIASFELGVAFQIRPGYIITMSDGVVEKSHVVTTLTLDGADIIGDRLWGTADPGTWVELVHHSERDIIRWEQADSDGYWEANFSEPGDFLPLEERTHDFAVGTRFMILQSNGDGHTQIDWEAPNPTFAVDTAANHIHGHGWPNGVPVTLTIDDPATGVSPDYTDTQTSVAEGEDTVVRFWPGEVFEIQPGHLVTLSDGVLTKEHTVTSLRGTGSDGYQNQIWGVAEPSTLVVIKLRWDTSVIRYETAGATGNWLADFSTAGDEPGEDKLYDFDVDTWLMVYQQDNDGDRTQIDFKMSTPKMEVQLTQNVINWWDWPPDYPVEVQFDDPATPASPDHSITVDPESPYFPEYYLVGLPLGEDYRVYPGHIVIMTNGFLTKSHIVSTLQVTDFNYDLDTISGTAEPNAEVYIQTQDNIIRHVIADGSGNWIADFSTPGEQEDEQFTFDLIPWHEGSASVSDEDHDSTQVTWPIEMSTWVDGGIGGYNWYAGEETTLTIDDPETPAMVDFTASAFTGYPPGPWLYTGIDFDIGQTFPSQPGHIVNLTQISHSKTCIVSPLQVSGVDYITDQVTGTSNPNDRVQVSIPLGQGDEWARNRYAQADTSGHWQVDFSQPGTHIVRHPNEIEIVDIVPNMDVLASVGDDNACFTTVRPNQPPQVGTISGAADPIPMSSLIQVSASFSDPDVGDAHNAQWDWGDGSTSEGLVDESAGQVSGSHAYTEAGVYTLELTLCDAAGECDQLTYQYLVVYDLYAGFVTGGGWIDSPAGAYTADLSLGGKANFGFVSKYQKGATVPTGNTEFQFHAADLNFHSDSYEWLVVTGSDYAKFKGVGTINGMGEYKFMLWAGDGTGTDGADTFRIKIWEEDEFGAETVVYDNGFDQAISGGSIVIHTKK